MNKIRVIAFYLPQFHSIPENDVWWGKGFTEWTNVGKAKKFYPGHNQPRVPADLGYYDLRVSETRQAQAELAKAYGIEGFCYWHYWFGDGKRLLERPFNEVLHSGQPDFDFCLAWANESWKGFAHGLKNRNVLIEQKYPGDDDIENHFYDVLPAFLDKRYIKVDKKPLFHIYKPMQLPDAEKFIEKWQYLAQKNGLPGIFFVAHTQEHNYDTLLNMKFDAVNTVRTLDFTLHKKSIPDIVLNGAMTVLFGVPFRYNFKKALKYFSAPEDSKKEIIPTLISGWDHTPRSGKKGLILYNSTPELFEKHAITTFETVKNKEPEHQIVFLKSWNEWAEGNYMEPDLKYGHGFLKALKNALSKFA